MNRKKLLFLGAIAFLFFACKTSVEYSQLQHIEKVNRIRYQKANEYLRKAGILYQKKQFNQSLQWAQRSLNEYVTFDGYYLMGMSYYQKNDFMKGLEYLLKAEKIKPNHEQLLLTLGLIYSYQQKYDMAILRLKKLLKINPSDPVYLYRLGLAYKEKGEYQKAIPYLEKANQKQFKYRNHVLLLLGDIYFELKEYQKSELYYQQLGKLQPGSKEVQNSKSQVKIAILLEKGNEAFKKKEYKKAEEWYRKIIDIKPDKKIGYLQLGILYFQLKDYSRAIQNFQKALEISKTLDTFLYLCKTYLEANYFLKTRTCLQNALKLYPDNEKLLHIDSLYYKKTGNLKKAISILNKILHRNPNSIGARKNLYLIALEEQKYRKARKYLKELKELDSSNQSYWLEEEKKLKALELVHNGNLWLKRRKYGRAKQLYLKALSLYRHPTIYTALGNFYFRLRNYKLAEKYYILAKNSKPLEIEAYENLLNFYKKTRKYRKYNQIRKEIIRKSNSNLSMGILYGTLLTSNGQYKEAIRFYLQLKKKFKDSNIVSRKIAYVYYKLAREENQKQNFSKAIQFIKKALKYYPSSKMYQNSLQVLQDNKKHKEHISLLEKAEEYYFKEEYDKAKEIYHRIYQKWKKPLILVRLAEIEFYTGNESLGSELLQKALNQKPKDPTILEAIYTRLLEQNRIQEAKKGFEDVLNLKEDAYFSYYKLGIIHLLKKQYKEAILYFEDSILYRPDFLPAKIGKGIALYFLKEFTSAKRIFEETSKQKGFGREIAMLNLALIQFNQKQNHQAKKELERLIRLFPDYSEAYYHLAYIEFENRNFLRAEALLKQAIQIQKNDRYYWALIRVYEAIPYRKKELKKTTVYFLKTYSNSPYYPKVKQIYLKIADTEEYFEVAYSKNINNLKIIPLEEYFLFYSSNELRLIKRNSEKLLYRILLPKIVDVKIDSYLWVLEEKSLKVYHFKNGEEIYHYPTHQYKNCKLLSTFPYLLLQSQSDCNQENSLFLNYKGKKVFPVPTKNIFFVNPFLYLIYKNQLYIIPISFIEKEFQKNHNSDVIQKNLKMFLIQDLKKETIKMYKQSGPYAFLETNQSIYIYKGKDLIHTIKNTNNTIKWDLQKNYLVRFEKKNIPDTDESITKIMIFHLESNQKKFEMDIQLFRDQKKSFYILNGEQFLYLDRDKNLHFLKIISGGLLKDKKQEEKIFRELKSYRQSIITFHY